MHFRLTFCLACCFIMACHSCDLDCSTVKCVVPNCIDTYTPPHQCCPICRPKPCNYKGQVYIDGQQFKDDCNTCTCSLGSVSCTQLGCPVNPTTCMIDGIIYSDGDELPWTTCETCHCRAGQVACYRKAAILGECMENPSLNPSL
ncbi:kielin/chordin-like protein [Dreissena polymorpha]|uniref:kielin/chordin-like protein n=1 Tax=Dreissena polymorpha TaxID=45954 RepID=UPI002264E030|nr:kielin/chordin-like protein [Dreissena polymorpha]